MSSLHKIWFEKLVYMLKEWTCRKAMETVETCKSLQLWWIYDLYLVSRAFIVQAGIQSLCPTSWFVLQASSASILQFLQIRYNNCYCKKWIKNGRDYHYCNYKDLFSCIYTTNYCDKNKVLLWQIIVLVAFHNKLLLLFNNNNFLL